MTVENNNKINNNNKEDKASLLAPLTVYERIQKNQIFDCYSSYWEDSIAIKPHIKYTEIQHILADAAEVVSRIRNFVDTVINKDKLLQIRVKDGIAHDFLFHTELITKDYEEFLKELVESTLKVDKNTYETGLSKEIIDAFLSNFLVYRRDNPHEEVPYSAVEQSADNLANLLDEIRNLTLKVFDDKIGGSHKDQKEDNSFLKRITKSLESVYLDLHRYTSSSRFVHVVDSSDSSDLSDLDDFVMVEDDKDEKVAEIPAIDTDLNRDIKVEEAEQKNEDISPSNDDNNNEEVKEEVKVEESAIKLENDENKIEENKDQSSEEPKETQSEGNNEEINTFTSSNDIEEVKEEIKEVKIEESNDQDVKEEDKKEEIIEKNEESNDQVKEESREIENKEPKGSGDKQSEIPVTEGPKIDLRSSGIIKIAKVESNIESTVKEIEQLRDLVNNLTFDPSEDPKTSLKRVEELLRKCLFWGEALMRDLLTLDTISADKYPSSDDIRPLRKKKAVQIQSLMDEIEALKSPLKKFQSDFSKLVEKQNAEKTAGSSSSPSTPTNNNNSDPSLNHADQKNNSNNSSPARSTPPHKDNKDDNNNDNQGDKEEEEEENSLYSNLVHQWKLLKIEPQFETERQRGRYLVYASLPGMKDEDFKLQINEREGSLTISGCRLPSRDEVELLKNNLLRRYKFSSESDLAKQLFRYGLNRFGSFSSSFSLPNNVNTAKIEAKYEEGILYVIIPVKAPQQPQQPQHPYNPFSRGGYNRHFNNPSNFYSPNNFFF